MYENYQAYQQTLPDELIQEMMKKSKFSFLKFSFNLNQKFVNASTTSQNDYLSLINYLSNNNNLETKSDDQTA